MVNRLLDRQASLLDYLTSTAAIFGHRAASTDKALHGIDIGLLRLEARFSHEKRMEKITAVFPRTFELLGSNEAGIIREFVEICPPLDISRLENARQFHDFLLGRSRRKALEPPYLLDVATCEFACALVRLDVENQPPGKCNEAAARGTIRRRSGVILLRCGYDIRPIFEEGCRNAIPANRCTLLAITMPPGANQPGVFEVLPMVFDLLAALDDWTDPAALVPTPDLAELIRNLLEHRLIEVCR
jgi:hypothetical protein